MAVPYGGLNVAFAICTTQQTSVPANAAAYQALSYTAVGYLNQIGEYGDESALITAATTDQGRVFKQKGPRDAGTLDILVLDMYGDAGQAALVAAQAAGGSVMYAFRMTLPNNQSSPGTTQYDFFCGLVLSQRLQQVTPNDIVKRKFSIAINSAITTVAPT